MGEELRDVFGKLGLDTTEFKTGIAAANRELRVLESGFRASAAAYGDWGKSLDGLTLRSQSLTRQIDVQAVKVEAARIEYERIAATMGKTSRQAQDAQVRLNKETETLNRMSSELSRTKTALDKFADSAEDAGDQTDKLADEEKAAEKATLNFSTALKSLVSALPAAVQALGNMAGAAAGFAGRVGSAVGGILTSVASVGLRVATTFATIAAAGAAAFAGLVATSIGPASDLSETTNQISVTFSDASDSIFDFADNAALALGQSRQQSLDAAGTFGVFGRSARLTGSDLSDFSTSLVTAASDLASFRNKSPDQAIKALSGALRGETEGLREFGILIDDASVKQAALANGIITTTSEALTPQQRVLATYKVIMDQMTLANGDFERTSKGAANQVRILTATWANFRADIGRGVLPLWELLLQRFTAFVTSPQIQGGIKAISDGFNLVSLAIVNAFDGDGILAMNQVREAITALGTAFGVSAVDAEAFGSDVGRGVWAVVEALKEGFDPGAGLIDNVLTFLDRVSLKSPLLAPLADVFETIVGYVQDFQDVIAGADGNMSRLGEGIGRLVSRIGTDLLANKAQLVTMATGFVTGLAQAITAAIPELLPVANSVLAGLLQFLTQGLPALASVGVSIISTIVRFLRDNATALADSAVDIIVTLITGIAPLLPLLLDAAVQIIAALVAGLGRAMPTIGPVLIKMLTDMVGVLLDNNGRMIEAGIELIAGLIEGFARSETEFIKQAPVLIKKYFDAILREIPLIIELGTRIVTALIKGMEGMGPAERKALKEIVETMAKSIPQIAGALASLGIKIVEYIISGMLGYSVKFNTALLGIVKGGVNNAGNNVRRPAFGSLNGASLASAAAGAMGGGGGLPASSAGSGAGIAGSQPINITVHIGSVASGIDVYRLAQQVGYEAQKARGYK